MADNGSSNFEIHRYYIHQWRRAYSIYRDIIQQIIPTGGVELLRNRAVDAEMLVCLLRCSPAVRPPPRPYSTLGNMSFMISARRLLRIPSTAISTTHLLIYERGLEEPRCPPSASRLPARIYSYTLLSYATLSH